MKILMKPQFEKETPLIRHVQTTDLMTFLECKFGRDCHQDFFQFNQVPYLCNFVIMNELVDIACTEAHGNGLALVMMGFSSL